MPASKVSVTPRTQEQVIPEVNKLERFESFYRAFGKITAKSRIGVIGSPEKKDAPWRPFWLRSARADLFHHVRDLRKVAAEKVEVEFKALDSQKRTIGQEAYLQKRKEVIKEANSPIKEALSEAKLEMR